MWKTKDKMCIVFIISSWYDEGMSKLIKGKCKIMSDLMNKKYLKYETTYVRCRCPKCHEDILLQLVSKASTPILAIDVRKESKSPLIKDGRIRKAVRAWADYNKVKVVSYVINGDSSSVLYDESKGVTIDFTAQIPGIQDDREYTIVELFGEEE